jgi:hypothetical protein
MTDTSHEAFFDEVARPALIRFQVGLIQSTKDLERWRAEGAAVAIAATITFIKNMNWDLRYLAPLEEALEMVEKHIDPESLPYCRRVQAMIGDLDSLKKKGLPSLDDFRKGPSIPRKDVNRIAACVAIDYQRKCKVPLPEALKKIVGRNPVAARKLEDFRDSLRRTKSGPKRELYDRLTQMIKDLDPNDTERAARSLHLYKMQIGEKP